VQLLLGGWLLISGKTPATDLHIVYGSLPVAVMFIAEQLRAAAAEQILEVNGFQPTVPISKQLQEKYPDDKQKSEAVASRLVLSILRREIFVMTAAAAVCLVLVIRAAQISGHFL